MTQGSTSQTAPSAAPQFVQEGPAAAQAAVRSAEAARDEIENQIQNLLQERKSVADRLREGGAAKGPDLSGLESRIALLDKQLGDLYVNRATAAAAVVQAKAVPGSTPPFIPRPDRGPPEEVVAIIGMFIFFVCFPIVIAYSRRIWRRGAQVTKLPPELNSRLDRLEQSVESVAVEVERIGEGQRFVTNLFIEGGPQMLGAGPMNTLEVKERERVESQRSG